MSVSLDWGGNVDSDNDISDSEQDNVNIVSSLNRSSAKSRKRKRQRFLGDKNVDDSGLVGTGETDNHDDEMGGETPEETADEKRIRIARELINGIRRDIDRERDEGESDNDEYADDSGDEFKGDHEDAISYRLAKQLESDTKQLNKVCSLLLLNLKKHFSESLWNENEQGEKGFGNDHDNDDDEIQKSHASESVYQVPSQFISTTVLHNCPAITSIVKKDQLIYYGTKSGHLGILKERDLEYDAIGSESESESDDGQEEKSEEEEEEEDSEDDNSSSDEDSSDEEEEIECTMNPLSEIFHIQGLPSRGKKGIARKDYYKMITEPQKILEKKSLKSQNNNATFEEKWSTRHQGNPLPSPLPGRHIGDVLCLGISPDGSTLFSGGHDRFIHCWNIEESFNETTGEPTYELVFREILSGHRDAVTSILVNHFDPSGAMKSSRGKTIIIGGSKATQKKLLENQNEEGTSSSSFGTGGMSASQPIIVYSCSLDRTVKEWTNGINSRTLYGHQEGLTDICFLKFNAQPITVGLDRTVRLWKVQQESQLVYRYEDNFECCCQISPTRFVTGSSDGTLALWDVKKKRPLWRKDMAHATTTTTSSIVSQYGGRPAPWITSICRFPGGDLLATGSSNGLIRLWRIAQPTEERRSSSRPLLELIAVVPCRGIVTSMAFDGREYMLLAAISKEPRMGRWYKYTGPGQAINGIIRVDFRSLLNV
eukprot:g1872.t1